MLKIKIFVFNPFQVNTCLLFDETLEAVIIDAGCFSVKEEETLDNFIKDNNLKLVHLLNTHCHVDHVIGNKFIVENHQIGPQAHKSEEFLNERAQSQGQFFGIDTPDTPKIKKFIEEGMRIEFGNSYLDIAHVPGHSPGSLVYYNKEKGLMVAGDVLFNGSIGRTDLPGGNYQDLITNIQNKLFTMEDKMVVYPGHGSSTTIGKEKKTNPYFKGIK